ncbi:hypothetical protein [Dactylosporangium salmoneum]|uniref:Toxin-antitoxin system, toxin component n=1 Tax=Dactylosporangium salmoneum TaxID=53361 RepID=A0ABP5SA86_9ACTN
MTQPYAAPVNAYAPGPGGQPALRCRFCGCAPAVKTTFRGHQGIIILMRFLSLQGPFCRDCGLATFRDMTSKTLVQGWYSYGSVIAAPVTVLINLVRRLKFNNLGAPQPAPDGSSGTPMDPGKPLMARPMTIIGLCIPVAVIVLIILAVSMDTTTTA